MHYEYNGTEQNGCCLEQPWIQILDFHTGIPATPKLKGWPPCFNPTPLYTCGCVVTPNKLSAADPPHFACTVLTTTGQAVYAAGTATAAV